MIASRFSTDKVWLPLVGLQTLGTVKQDAKKEIKQATWSRKLQNGKTDIYMTAMAVSKLGPEIGNQ